ncbi:MAG: succinylglutamate desuccinylase/aspartoacylase family protein [Candidatus Hodarchaeota archaeon]
MSKIQIRNIEVDPGEKIFGYLPVAETPTYTVKLPCGIVNGTNPGLTVSIIAGLHPTEYCGMEAATRLFQQISPTDVSGALLITPVVNIPGFQVAADHVNPLDGLNLNRIFPGDPVGSISQRMIHVLFDEVIRLADVHLDLHSGEAIEAVPHYAIIPNTGTELDEESANLARIYAPHLNQISGQPGTSTQEASMRLKIPAITAEAGGLGNYDEIDINFHLTGLINVLKYLKILPGHPSTINATPEIFTGSQSVRASRGGIFYPFVAEGAQVNEGQSLAQIKNIEGDVLETMHSPVQGLVGMFRPKRVKNSGDLAYIIWTS